MKELSIEEKAKRYDEAIKKVNDYYEGKTKLYSDIDKTLDYLFPALKESEDEIIRKELINYVEKHYATGRSKVDKLSVLAWLEKQGKKTKPIESFSTEFERQISRLIASIINKEYSYTEAFVKWTSNALLNYAKHEIEKKGDKDKLIKELIEYKAKYYKTKYIQKVLEKYINSMSNKYDERLRKTTIAFLKEFAEQGYENAVECIDWLESMKEEKIDTSSKENEKNKKDN